MSRERRTKTFTFLLNLMVRLVASRILLLDYPQLWSTSQFELLSGRWCEEVITTRHQSSEGEVKGKLLIRKGSRKIASFMSLDESQ